MNKRQNSLRSTAGATVLVFVLMFLLVSPIVAAEKGLEIAMSYNGPPDKTKNAVHFFAGHFKEKVAEKTSGAIEVLLYPDNQLGDETQRMERVMNEPFINIASYAGVGPVFPELYAANIPFLFDSYAAGNRFFDNSEFWKKARKAFREQTGAELVCAVEEGGFLAFTNSRRPIKKPSDFKGLKFRAMDESQLTREGVESRVEDRIRFIAGQGVDVYSPTPVEMEMFREQGQPAYIDYLKDTMDQQWIDRALESARLANAAPN